MKKSWGQTIDKDSLYEIIESYTRSGKNEQDDAEIENAPVVFEATLRVEKRVLDNVAPVRARDYT